MQKLFVISIYYLVLIIQSAVAQGYNLQSFLAKDSDDFNDISYLHIVPEYEQDMDPNRAVAIEIYFGELEDTPESLAKLSHIKNILQDDKKLFNAKLELQIISKNPNETSHSSLFKDFLKATHQENSKYSHAELPNFLDYQAALNNQKKRYPSSLGGGRTFWSFIRFSSSAAGVFGGLYFMQGLPISVAATVALVPGLASGGITYFSNAYGSFLTNGKWATWLMESNSVFAKGMRKAFRLTPQNFEASLIKHQSYFKTKFPKLYDANIELFTRQATQRATEAATNSASKFTKLLSKLKTAEEYVKWWVTEVAFTAVAIKIPQAMAGVTEAGTLLSSVGDVLAGSTMGMLAQGPGDIAIQKRKYQKIEELKADVIAGKVKTENKKALLEEIEKVLAKSGPHQGYTIHEGSHLLLKKIENWSRSRATILSFFSVTGVGLEIAGVPAARPLLLGVGIWGAGYYANVAGWISPSKITEKFKNLVQKIRNGEIKFSMSFLKNRYCASVFQYAN